MEIDIPGLNKTQNNDQGQYLIANNAGQAHSDNGYVTSKLSSAGTLSEEQRCLARDFHSLVHTVGNSSLSTLDFFGVNCEPTCTDSLRVQHPAGISYQPQSNYYPSDVSSGYRSDSCTSGDTSLYLGDTMPGGLKQNELRININDEEDS